MAQLIQAGRITPADELRDLLSSAEKRAASVVGSGENLVQLLLDADRIAALWPVLEAEGVDLRPEAGRWETFQKSLRRQASNVVRELAAFGGIAAARKRAHPQDTGAWWWHLDTFVRERRRRHLGRMAITTAVVVAVGIGLWLLLRLLFPVDPAVREAMIARDRGDSLIQEAGDVAGALLLYQRAVAANPIDSDAWLRVGALLEQRGDAQGAAAAFARASALIGGDIDFRLARGGAYLTVGMLDEAERELDATLAIAPDNPYAYYLLASVFETRDDLLRAIDALSMASQLADEQKNPELTALARVRMGFLMQRPQLAPQETPSPAP